MGHHDTTGVNEGMSCDNW